MEPTALRPKPMPGRATGARQVGPRPHAVHRRRRRLLTVLFTTSVALVLVLAGVGLGTVGVTAVGMSKLAELEQRVGAGSPPAAPSGSGHLVGEKRQGARGQQGNGGPAAREREGGKRADGAGEAADKGAPRARGRGSVLRRTPRATLGVEAVDAPNGAGAVLVGVHGPGPGHSAGLVRGDTLVVFGGVRVRSAAELAEAVADAKPGTAVSVTVRHRSGERRQLAVVPGVVT
ncbi:PDZ domain-containing protein [Streptomyces sp. NPDC002851]